MSIIDSAKISTHFCDENPSEIILQLHQLLKSKQYDAAVEHIQANSAAFEPKNFAFNANGYTRNVLCRIDNYWLMVLRWDNKAQTPIHGHPEQAFVRLLSGEFSIDNYHTKTKNLLETVNCQCNQHYINHGVPDTMDNAVHKITALKPSLSLHFYSDDPGKGEVF